MTSRDERGVQDAVHPFRAAVSSLNAPAKEAMRDFEAMDDLVSCVMRTPSILDFSPFDTLDTMTKDSTVAEKRPDLSELEPYKNVSNAPTPTSPDPNQSAWHDGAEKTPPIFSFRRTVSADRKSPQNASAQPHEMKRSGEDMSKASASYTQDAKASRFFERPSSQTVKSESTGGLGLLNSLTDSLLMRKAASGQSQFGKSQWARRTSTNVPIPFNPDEHNSSVHEMATGVIAEGQGSPFDGLIDQMLFGFDAHGDAQLLEDGLLGIDNAPRQQVGLE